MSENFLEQLWEKELFILDKVVEVCKKHNLKYYLMWGTLIGAIRHKGFIPWDDDIDINMPRKDYEKFLKVAQRELGEQFFVQTCFNDKFHPAFFAKVRLNNTAFYAKADKNVKKHHGIFIDIIPLDDRKDKFNKVCNLKYKLFKRLDNYVMAKRQGEPFKKFSLVKLVPVGVAIRLRNRLLKGKGEFYSTYRLVFDKSDFEPAVEVDFCGKRYFAPNKYDSVLTKIYGDYMQLPPENQRVAHNPAFISFDLEKDKEAHQKYLEGLNAK